MEQVCIGAMTVFPVLSIKCYVASTSTIETATVIPPSKFMSLVQCMYIHNWLVFSCHEIIEKHW